MASDDTATPSPHGRIAESGAFPGVASGILEELDAALQIVELEPGEVLFRQGDTADRMYVLLAGRLAVTLESGAAAGPDDPGQDLGGLGPGDVVGEVALLSGTRRTATVLSETAATVGALAREDIDRIAANSPGLIDGLLASSVHRLRRSQLAAFLTSMFGPLEPALLDQLDGHVEWIRLHGGDVVFRAGDPGDSGYGILAGRIRVINSATGRGEPAISELGRGQPLGITTLFTKQPRSVTAIAVRDSELIRIGPDAIRWFAHQRPTAAFRIMAVLADRLERSTAGRPASDPDGPRAVTIAVVPIGGTPAAQFGRSLASAIEPYGRTLFLTADDAAAIVGSGEGSAAVPLHHWLNEREAAHDFLVYLTDPTLTPWTEQCLRQADQVVTVVRSEEDPTPGPLELALADRWLPIAAPRQTLVLLRPAEGGAPHGTARWLAGRSVDRHLHVRVGVEGDIARVGRLLVGRAVTLVLGGGGARGYAHVGVVRALEDVGIPIDMVGGTSMGALIAGGVASGWTAAEGRRHLATSAQNLFDPTLPLVSILSGRRIWRALDSAFGDVAIEDLALPFFCISTNLTRAEPVIHQSGSLSRALRASASLPGILPPVYADGDLLVDGGLLDMLPIAAMRRLNGGGRVVAVDVSPPVDVAAEEAFGVHLSGWRVLRNRLTRASPRPRMPGIVELMSRVVVVPSVMLRGGLTTGDEADLLIQPSVGRWGMLDFKRVAPIERAGYEAAIGPLGDWWEAEQGRR